MISVEPVENEPVQYSSKESPGQRLFNYIFAIFLVVIFLVFLGFGLYYLANPQITDSGILAAILIPVGIILGALAFVIIYLTNHHQRYEYRFELTEAGIFEEKIYPKKDKVEESQILFEDMTKVLIGNYVEYVALFKKGQDFSHFKFKALLVVIHKDGVFLRVISDQDDLNLWISRLMDKEIPMYYTDYNLLRAPSDYALYQIDFNEIDAVPWEEVKAPPNIGHSDKDNPYMIWESEDIKKLKSRDKLRKTKKIEKNVLKILFFYAILIGGVFLTQLSLDEHGEIELTGPVFLFVFLVNIFIPIIFVFWRPFTKWYMLFAYYLLVTAGNLIGLGVGSLLLSNPVFTKFIDVISLNIAILFFGWLPGLLIVKVIKFLFLRVFKNKI